MKRRQEGLTLIELVVTLAVAIVLLAIGIPAFRALDVNDRLASQVNSLVGSLNQARLEAIGGSYPVALCAAASPIASTCSGANWLNGWLIFQDGFGAPGVYEPASGDVLIRRLPALSGAPQLSNAVAFVRFDGKGERTELDVKKNLKDLNLLVLKLNHEGASSGKARWVCVSRTGQIRAEREDRGSDQCK